ncbi:MAG: hypothetical protein CBC33_009785 [Coraliomargarita sp. TMED73]|nr:MAG: hypothetical protein CBC33_009785 [Coraliomargarita sp. TMED73]
MHPLRMNTEKNIQSILFEKARNEPISFRDFIEIALYADDFGYYRRQESRVGRSPDRDFYTAESLGRVFSELIVDASKKLLGTERASHSRFIEIAAEPGRSLIDRLASPSPFQSSEVIRLGDRIEVTGSVVLFANEWLDARPFHRLRFENGRWRERGVYLSDPGILKETLLETLTPPVAAQVDRLPANAPEGYELDWPLEAEECLSQLLSQDWNGLLLLFDYGKSWKALLEDCPAGTARCYQHHVQSNNLLESPGKKDITCDLCWDPLVDQLKAIGCVHINLESQESFFVRRAANAAQKIVQKATTGGFNTDRQTLMELIHPAHMGQRFQALWAIREEE